MAHLERHDAYKYLDFNFRATKNLANGVSFHVAAANKAMPAMQRRCAFLQFSDPAVKCDLLTFWFYQFSATPVKFGPLMNHSALLVKSCTGNFCDSCFGSGKLSQSES